MKNTITSESTIRRSWGKGCTILSVATTLILSVIVVAAKEPVASDTSESTFLRHLKKVPATSRRPRKKYIRSNGPLYSKVRIIDSSIVDGYTSCSELQNDIVNALKYYANSVILSEKDNDWYADCDPNDPDPYYYPGRGDGGIGGEVLFAAEASSADSASAVQEDSFETNVQVEGVDEADVVKSDGTHVFAAYGSTLYAWDAVDGKGTSITHMPKYTQDDTEFDSKILSLLLHGSRLAVITSQEDQFSYQRYYDEDYVVPVIDDSTISIRVYDISDVPEGSELKIVGEKTIKGEYEDARSIESTGIIMARTHVNVESLVANDLYRSRRNYCGFSNAQYERKATKTAMQKVRKFARQLMSELEKSEDCTNMFQIRAVGDSNGGIADNLLSQYVQVISFNMSADYADKAIPVEVSGAFSPGWFESVYASQDFAAAVFTGSKYNQAKDTWDEHTHVVGFDISSSVPEPLSYGVVPGEPINQYALDLFNGNLRIATTSWDWNNDDSSTTNKIFVLSVPKPRKRRGQRAAEEMSIIGETDHLGLKNEQIYAVRFIQDKAYVVTFENTDPFLIVDLGNPKDPKVVGELKIPGFSSYLHPIEVDGKKLMLGIGQSVDERTGWQEGVKISLFDISNPARPVEKVVFVDPNSNSDAQHDFKSFRYLSQSQKLILHKSEYTWRRNGNFDGFVVYNVTADTIAPDYHISHASSTNIYRGCWSSNTMPPRSLVFKSKLTTLLSHSVVSTDLASGEEEWTKNLDENRKRSSQCYGYFDGY